MAKKKVIKEKSAKKKSKSKKKHANKKPSVSSKKSEHKKKITKKSLKTKQPPAKGSNIKPKIKQEPKKKVGLTLNWNRAIHINKSIDDVLLKELTPIVLKMKQESSRKTT